MQHLSKGNSEGKQMGNIGQQGRLGSSKDLMNAKEAAEYLRVSPGTLYNWVSQGRLRPGRAGNRLRFRREDLDRFLWGISGKEG